MIDLSPVAQAVVNGALEHDYGQATPVLCRRLAAALRAAADQVVPKKPEPRAHLEGGELNVDWDDWRACQRINAAFRAIATELEGAQ